ncbi:MAG: 30S ribosomal protein S15 [Candidatus Omnitrophica bacterium]|nr:30S ribosomal protein S15 [Candidatus Omnitrophota bacterium]
MALEKKTKNKIISELSHHEKDTGSPEVQIALFTKRIEELTKHFQRQKKDYGSRRGLLILIGRRRKLLNYLKREDPARYEKLIAKLKLRR